MAIKWTADLSVGFEKVDNQHKKLFEIVNQLTEACNAGRGKEEVGNVLKFLQSYVKDHFRDEEILMSQNKYPDFEAHKKIHSDFTNKIDELITKFNQEGVKLNIVISTNKMVYEWLRNHIMNMDKAFGAFVTKKS